METENSQEMDGWRVKHNQLEKDYYKNRHDLYNMVERYYRQNPYGDYVNEDQIIDICLKLKTLRSDMKQLSKDTYPDTTGVSYKIERFPRYGFV
jgi:hypothetical protein